MASLLPRRSDTFDFHEVAVWSVRSALLEAERGSAASVPLIDRLSYDGPLNGVWPKGCVTGTCSAPASATRGAR